MTTNMLIKEQIDFQLSLVLCEASSGFDLRFFKQIPEAQQQINYASTYLKKLGSGSSRVVFLLSGKYVLKISRKDLKGPAQNKAEVDIYTSPKVKPIVAKIYDFDDKKYNWLISEAVRELKNTNEFESLTGVSFHLFKEVVNTKLPIKTFVQVKIERVQEELGYLKDPKHANKRGIKGQIANMEDKIEALQSIDYSPGSFISAVSSLANNTSLIPADLTIIEHWGKTANGRVVLLDYGYTEEVYRTAYKRH